MLDFEPEVCHEKPLVVGAATDVLWLAASDHAIPIIRLGRGHTMNSGFVCSTCGLRLLIFFVPSFLPLILFNVLGFHRKNA